MRSFIAIAGAAALASAQNLDVPGYNRESLNDAAINAPVTDNCYTYMQHSTYSNVTSAAEFSPERCIQDCEETSAYNKQYLNNRATCRFVNTYILLKDGVSQGQICSMYTATWDDSYATNTGYTDDDGSVYTITESYTYSNITDPGVPGQDCVGGPYEPQPPCPSTSTMSPAWPTSTIPSYSSSTFATVTVPTTTSSISIPTTPSLPTTTSQSVIVPTTTSQSVIVPTTTSQSVVAPTPTTPVVVPTSSAAAPSTGTGNFECTGLLSSPECCQVNALDAASLTCLPPPSSFTTREQFRSICAATGTTAQCCLLPVLGQALVCQDV